MLWGLQNDTVDNSVMMYFMEVMKETPQWVTGIYF